MTKAYYFFIFFLTLIISCSPQEEPADHIYHNGVIIPMTGASDRAEAISIKDGKIQSIGTFKEVQKHISDSTVVHDLAGKTLLPGFIDAHSHFALGMQYIDFANVASPPVGDVKNIADIVSKLEALRDKTKIAKGEWVIGFGFDPDLLEEQRYPNKFDLDEAFPDHPVALIHVSNHLATVNSLALNMLGITANTKDPEGGEIRRVKNSNEPNGVLAESAAMMILKKLPQGDPKELYSKMQKTVTRYASRGITTAQEGYSTPEAIEFLLAVSKDNKLPIDIVSLVGFQEMAKYIGDPDFVFGEYHNGVKFGGIKVISDGSPQGKTAKMKEPYLTEVPGCSHHCTGISYLSQEQLDQIVATIYKSGIQLYTHCNGDAAIDMLLTAHKKALELIEKPSAELRSVIIHSQFMRPDLIEEYKTYGLLPSYFTNHTFFWGDVHMLNMGAERANYISPMRASIDAGIKVTNHSDFPITPLDQMFMIWSASERVSRSGQPIGKDQKISRYEAIEALTKNVAYQYHEEAIKGTLELGKMADMVILSDDPTSVSADDLLNIKVMSTIKEGNTIFDIE